MARVRKNSKPTSKAKSSNNRSRKTSSSSSGSSGSKWFTIGTFRERENDEGEVNSYLVINKNVDIFVNGEEVDLGEYRVVKLFDAQTSAQKLMEGGHIDENELNDRLQFIDDKGIVFNLTIPPTD